MKNVKNSPYLYLAIVAFIFFFIHLFTVRHMVLAELQSNSKTQVNTLTLYSPVIWLSFAGLFLYKATTFKQSLLNQLLAFLFTPVALLPFEALFYVLIVLTPLYNLVGKTVLK